MLVFPSVVELLVRSDHGRDAIFERAGEDSLEKSCDPGESYMPSYRRRRRSPFPVVLVKGYCMQRTTVLWFSFDNAQLADFPFKDG
jgi:hypothetical protein